MTSKLFNNSPNFLFSISDLPLPGIQPNKKTYNNEAKCDNGCALFFGICIPTFVMYLQHKYSNELYFGKNSMKISTSQQRQNYQVSNKSCHLHQFYPLIYLPYSKCRLVST